MKKPYWLAGVLFFTLISCLSTPAHSLTLAPQIAEDKDSGYDRSLFKHWIDADKNGCNTRAEVLISEALVKPKVDKKCKISGGKWLSAYDKKSVSNSSQLDVDHLVPLAEAWRSGAWAWTAEQRQDFANDLSDKRALIAVTLTTNRSKGDKDISEWVPKVDTCGYVQNWIAIKIRYSLTYDTKEAAALSSYFAKCNFGEIPVQALTGFTYQSQPVESAEPSPTPEVSDTPVAAPTPTVTPTPAPSATPTSSKPSAIKYKNCTEAKAAGVTPIRKTTDPELYALNTALDGDKDGDACES
jgi:hypothetical protein